MAGHDVRAAKRYATALFQAAQKENVIDSVEQDLNAVDGLMSQTPKLSEFWYSPLIPANRKREILRNVIGKSLTPLTLAFLELLIDKRREETLGAIEGEFRLLADISRHLVRAEATFAVAPTTEEQSSLSQSLEQRTGQHVQLTVHVDPSIMGGVVVRMQDTIIDGSVRGTLERLREQLLQEA